MSKLLNELDIRSFSFGELIDFFCDEFKVSKKLFKTDEYGELEINNPMERQHFKKTFKEVIKNLQEKIPQKNTILEKQLLMLKDIFKLENDEYGIMTYCVVQEINNVFKNLFDCINHDKFSNFAKMVLNIRHSRRLRIAENLYLKNLTDSKRGSNIEVNPEILKVFDNHDCRTTNQLIKILLGKNEKSTLKLNDYKHIENERIKVVNILKSAVEQKRKGIKQIILINGHFCVTVKKS